MTVALFLAYVLLPLAGMLPGIIAPAPGIYYALKRGRTAGFAIIAVTGLVLVLTTDVAVLAIYLLQCGIMTLTIPEFLRRGKGGSRAIVYSVATNILIILAAAGFFSLYYGIDLHAQVLHGVNSSIEQTISLYEKTGIAGEELNGLRMGMQKAGVLIGRIYPALVAIGLGMIASINLFVVARVATRVLLPLQLGEFAKYKNPEQLVWLLIAAGFAMLVDNSLVNLSAANILIVLVVLYFTQGLAITRHLFKRFTVPVFVRGIFYLLIAVQPFMALAVALLGVFDLWGDFRSPKKQENL